MVKKKIIAIIDAFYFPFFRRFIPLQTFRYAICGGANIGFDIVLYFLLYNFVLQKQNLDLSFVVISPEIAAFLITFPVTFFTGLWLSKNISFQNSVLAHRTQAFRYFLVVLMNIAIKYWGLKLCVEVLRIFPSVSNAIMTVITIIFSYLMQNHFTFKGNKPDIEK